MRVSRPACVAALHLEAALHLGRVRLLEGQDAPGARWLRQAAGSTRAPVRYLVELFLGAAAGRTPSISG